eukprot:3691092-Heterocapsa_arctica.AAC.1
MMTTGAPCNSSRVLASRQLRQYTSCGTRTSRSRLGTRTERHPGGASISPGRARNRKADTTP